MTAGEEEAGRGELRVGAHVLVQLGAELVTDAEQALLECVKNAYDADAPGCRITVDTRIEGELRDRQSEKVASLFSGPAENVRVTVSPVERTGEDATPVAERTISYQGSVVIEDKGVGIDLEGLRDSWLVVSSSAKRSASGPKAKTPLGRTPLGDKGLGRLGTMKLGDVLLVETARSVADPVSYAWFRWADCDRAATVDQVPVTLDQRGNAEGLKGTRVSVLGLRDIDDWRRPKRLDELVRSMARLISPFEAASTFPVAMSIDEREQSLGTVSAELLGRAIASFDFEWKVDEEGTAELVAEARLSRRLFTSERTDKLRARTEAVFSKDEGAAFLRHLPSSTRLKGYEIQTRPAGRWMIELKRRFTSEEVLGKGSTHQPGPFKAAFYYFFFIPEEEQSGDAVAGQRLGLRTVRDLAGIYILRDGFQIRSRGDWLDLSAGMTSGSTYNMRPENTIGYFALTGEHNHALKEKSDREGFVDDAYLKSFMTIARACRDFANRALVASRRTLDDYAKDIEEPSPTDASGAARKLDEAVAAARQIGDMGAELAALVEGIDAAPIGEAGRQRAVALVRQVTSIANKAAAGFEPGALPDIVSDEIAAARERNEALVESAAVGQAARGLTHELGTHLAEIRFRSSSIERDRAGTHLKENVTAIRRSCSAIAAAASQIDPLLPRARAVRDRIEIVGFINGYFDQRREQFEALGIATAVFGRELVVRMNRARLLQAFDNLVRNSRYWLERGRADGRAIQVEIGDIGFVLSDNGPGVDPQVEDTLFELFVTTRSYEDGGQGLGLFISSELLALDGCSISLLPQRNSGGRRHRFAVDLAAVAER